MNQEHNEQKRRHAAIEAAINSQQATTSTIEQDKKEIARLREEVAAWQAWFPQYEYRKQDECIALKVILRP